VLADIATNLCRVQATSIAASLLAHLALHLRRLSDTRDPSSWNDANVMHKDFAHTAKISGDFVAHDLHALASSACLGSTEVCDCQVANHGTKFKRLLSDTMATFVHVEVPAGLAVQSYLAHLLSLDSELHVLLLRPCMLPTQCMGIFVRALTPKQRTHVAFECLRQCLRIIGCGEDTVQTVVEVRSVESVKQPGTGDIRVKMASQEYSTEGSHVSCTQHPHSCLFWLQVGVTVVREGHRIAGCSKPETVEMSKSNIDSALCTASNGETVQDQNVLFTGILQAVGKMLQHPSEEVHARELCHVLDACMNENIAVAGLAKVILENAIMVRSAKDACFSLLGRQRPVKRKLHEMLDRWGDELEVLHVRMARLEAQFVS
jgi:hypothetical protein